MPMLASQVCNGLTFEESKDEDGQSSAPVSHTSALVQLRAYIQNAEFKEGQKLPPERVLGPELGLRRFELRKALETLVDEGMLWRHVGKGTFMARMSDQSDQNDLSALARKISPADVMRARLSLEPALARDAAMHAPASAVAALRQTIKRSLSAATWREYEALDNDFHRQVAEASGSVVLLALFDQLNTLRRMIAWGHLTRADPRPPHSHMSFREHEVLADAIADRDAEAAHNAMRAHLRSVEDRLFRAS